jgi:hypothetical protein
VKFVAEYNIRAHNICHDGGYAPRIIYSSNSAEFKALGGYRMIIMECVGISLDKKLQGLEIRSHNSIYEDVKSAIDLLHKENLVFADLRSPNILVYNDRDGIQRAMLVDFDWCGRENVSRYPPSLNLSILWPTDVKPYSLLKKTHDLYRLEKLQELLRCSIFSFSLVHLYLHKTHILLLS